jgi:hypothetical protein
MSLAIESPLQKNNFISNEAIAYALNIQRGMLPQKRHLKKYLPILELFGNHTLFYQAIFIGFLKKIMNVMFA